MWPASFSLPKQYPLNAAPGETLFFDRPHQHQFPERWEPMPGGAVGRCRLCGFPVALTLIVLATDIPRSQARWVAAILNEPEPIN
jgi:hypothetical protein